MANKNRNRGNYASNENWENPGYNRERDYSQEVMARTTKT